MFRSFNLTQRRCEQIPKVYPHHALFQYLHQCPKEIKRKNNFLIKSEKKNQTHSKNWPLVKNQQFFSNPHETWGKGLSHEVIKITKFHKDWTKIVDFLLMANC